MSIGPKTVGPGVLDRISLAIRIVRLNPEISAEQLGRRLGVSTRSAHRYLNALAKAGIVERQPQPMHVVNAARVTEAFVDVVKSRAKLVLVPAHVPTPEKSKTLEYHESAQPAPRVMKDLPICLCGEIEARHPRPGCPEYWERLL